MDRHIEPLYECVYIEWSREHAQSHHEELSHLWRAVCDGAAGQRTSHEPHPVIHLLVLGVDPKVNAVHLAE